MAIKPLRVQRERTKGWRMPANTVYVGRPTDYGNPFYLNEPVFTRQICTDKYRELTQKRLQYPKWRELIKALRGKNLACYCPLNEPCHADVLLEVANAS